MTESSKLSVSENMKNKKQRTNGKKKKKHPQNKQKHSELQSFLIGKLL